MPVPTMHRVGFQPRCPVGTVSFELVFPVAGLWLSKVLGVFCVGFVLFVCNLRIKYLLLGKVFTTLNSPVN